LSRPLARLMRKSRRLYTMAALCHRTNPLWRFTYPTTLGRARRLCKKEGFEPAEAFRLGLFHPALSKEEVAKYVSRKRLTKAQKTLNPVGWAPLLKNKDIFYHFCAALDIPIPQLYAVIQPPSPGWSHVGRLPRTPIEWTTFFDKDLPPEFAIKPATGAYGHGFNIFRKASGRYTDVTGVHVKDTDLYETIVSPNRNRYIIQERLHSHVALARLSDTKALQTVRFITLIDRSGCVQILHAHLKVIENDEIVDTFIDGLKGNIEAPVDLQSGSLRPANRIPGTGSGVITLKVHPKTGIAFDGFELPFWPDACRLVTQTAPHFLPLRTIGWDVALTPAGAVMVEGNVWWDPHNQHGNMNVVLGRLSESGPPSPEEHYRP